MRSGEMPVFCRCAIFPLAVVTVVLVIHHCYHLVIICFISFTILNVDLEMTMVKEKVISFCQKLQTKYRKSLYFVYLTRPSDHALMHPPSVTLVLKTSVGIFMVETTTECE